MRALFLGLTLALAAFGQAGTPDCQFSFSFSASGTGTVFANKSTPCIEWRVTYYTASGTVVSLKLEGAADLSNAPTGSYTALTATQGSVNPAVTAAEGSIALCCDYYPWVRMNLTSFTGTTLSGRVYGWKAPETGPYSSSGPSGTQNVNVIQWGSTSTTLGQKLMAASVPVVIASDQSTVSTNMAQVGGTTTVTGGLAGSQGIGGLAAVGAGPTGNPVLEGWRDSAGVIVPEYCTSKFAFSNPGTGSTQLVAVSGSTTIRVCEFFFSGDTLTTVQLITGTGATCTSPTAETGVISGAGGGVFGIDIAPPNGALVTTAAKTLCLSLSAASTGGGYITYSQR